MSKQITEDYCSFEIAKLLKEKGFDELCFALYNPEGELIQCGVKLSNTQVERVPGSYSAQTHQMALKWLREVHQIDIEIYVYNKDFYGNLSYAANIRKNGSLMMTDSSFINNTYEQVVEAALLYVLKNLI